MSSVRVLAWLVLLGCGTGDRPVSDPPPTIAPDPGIAEETEPARAPASVPYGRWTSAPLCLVLFENGDFELVVQRNMQKTLILGTAAPAEDGAGVSLAVGRIWRARFTGRCRHVHETGHDLDEYPALGRTFRPGETVALRLARPADDALEVCAEECATLRRDEAVLGEQWRSEEGREGAPGTLFAIRFSPYPDLSIRGRDGARSSGSSFTFAVTPASTDRFTVEIAPTRVGAPTPALFARPFVLEETRTFEARRLAGQRLVLCEAEECTAPLARYLDPYSHAP